MNRRDFFSKLAKGIGVFTILPGAGRIWHAVKPPIGCSQYLDLLTTEETVNKINSLWVTAPYRIKWACSEDAFHKFEIGPPPKIFDFNPSDYSGVWSTSFPEMDNTPYE